MGRLLLLCLVALGACASHRDESALGGPCTRNKDCPSGSACTSGVCSALDSGVTDGGDGGDGG